ncbi:MAG: hypothetical protein ACYDDF_07240, partial [Thermoplasmatota archaeon]
MNITTARPRIHDARTLKSFAVSSLAETLPLPETCTEGTRRRIAEAAFSATAHRTSITDACETTGTLHPDTFFDNLRPLDHHAAETALHTTNTAILRVAKDLGFLPDECAIAIDAHYDPDYAAKHEGCVGYKGLPG